MDSFCSISTDTTQSILVYDTFAVVSIKPGINIESLPAWHPIWSDIYWVGQHHKIKVTAHIVKDWIHLKNVLTDDFIVEARNYDLQVNYVGLLAGNVAVPDDTISVGVSYNPVSAVSNSPSGPTAMFRSWFKITRVRTGVTVYSRYLDRTLAAGQDTCLYYQSGYVPSDSGWYRCRSYIEFRPGVDSIPDNNYMDRYFYAKLTNSDASATRTLKAIEVTYQRPLR